MTLKAVLFDLDGTVISDEDEYGVAFARVLERLGVKVSSEYPHVGGIGVEENWERFKRKYDLKTNMSTEELGAETQKEYKKLIPEITLKEGFEDFIKDLKASGVKVALATSNTWDIVEEIFDELGIEEYFDSVTTGEEVSRKKPDPEIFEIACEKLGVDPAGCLVFEDSEAGIDAAHSAGMKVIAVARGVEHRKELTRAERTVNNFSEVTPEMIESLQ